MARIDTTKGASGKAFDLLESDVYRMQIKKADLEEDRFAEADDNGNYPLKLVLVWEVYEATDEQDESVIGLSVWQRMSPWYGSGKRGDSQFKMLIDSLSDQGILDDVNPADFDTDALVGVRQRVTIEKYAKTMGANKGEPGNRVVGKPMPLTRRKPAPAAAAPAANTKPTRKVVPRLEEDEEIFEEEASTY